MKKSAIATGTLTDITLTKLFTLILLVILLDPGSASEAPIDHINTSLLDAFMLAWGTLFTGIGGFVAGRRAPHAPELHAWMAGLCSLVISHVCYGWSPEQAGMPLYLMGTLAAMPVAVLGGRLSRLWP